MRFELLPICSYSNWIVSMTGTEYNWMVTPIPAKTQAGLITELYCDCINIFGPEDKFTGEKDKPYLNPVWYLTSDGEFLFHNESDAVFFMLKFDKKST